MIVNKFLDKIDILKLKIKQDADNILKAIDMDELLKDPESYLTALGEQFMEQHDKEIKQGYKEGKKFANKIIEKS
ncbi:MAG: hypothetical protein Unbinned6747contig1000_9 [Prokaryotic dsDNA virus sp.]|nr:MAG: hypothetical protein Unbinned6747contig1000_9 [Prokaryotic dsDNA virus sp.]|tara:strand:+ start:26225 stop:26449 length:225 start_codon:yes stop_codon:yes gene_type:complete